MGWVRKLLGEWLSWAAELLAGEWVCPDPYDGGPCPLSLVAPAHTAPGLLEVWFHRQEDRELPALVGLVGTLWEARGLASRGPEGHYEVRTEGGRCLWEFVAVAAGRHYPGEG